MIGEIMKYILAYLWKLPLCGIAYFTGMMLSGILLPMLGFRPPDLPVGTDAGTIALWFFLGSMLIAFMLSFVSRHLQANWLARWLILVELVWVFGAVAMVLESFFFMTTGVVTTLLNAIFTLLNFVLPSLFLSVCVAVLFRPAPPCEPCLRAFFSARNAGDWLWRGATALLAYPLVYFVFGMIAQPFIRDFYATGRYELITPTWGQLILLQLVRSLLFLIVSLPVIVWWRGSCKGLWLALGLSVFVLTAFMAVITSYWFPWQLRLFHGLERLADGLAYTGVLTALFMWRKPDTKTEKNKHFESGLRYSSIRS